MESKEQHKLKQPETTIVEQSASNKDTSTATISSTTANPVNIIADKSHSITPNEPIQKKEETKKEMPSKLNQNAQSFNPSQQPFVQYYIPQPYPPGYYYPAYSYYYPCPQYPEEYAVEDAEDVESDKSDSIEEMNCLLYTSPSPRDS